MKDRHVWVRAANRCWKCARCNTTRPHKDTSYCQRRPEVSR